MSERRATGNTNRQCARSGCSAIAIATFTFDSATRTVWLDTPLDGNARAGELCARHARSLTPPRGWQLEDRRPRRSGVATSSERPPSAANAEAVETASPPRRVSQPKVPQASRASAQKAARGPAPQLAVGGVRGELEAELRGLLDAHSPLLARAFRSSGPV